MNPDDFEFKKAMFGGGSVKLTSWHNQEEITSHMVEYSDIPVTILLTEEGDAYGLKLYLEKKRMQGERTIALENQIIDDLVAGQVLTRDYLLGKLREGIAKAIDPECKDADELLRRRFAWHPGEEHPDELEDH